MPSDANLIAPAVDDNISGTRMLLQSLPKTTAKLIFSGTIDVYAPLVDHDATLTERARTEPDTLYGASKLFCESLISTWAKQRNCEYAILRYGHIYGPGEDQYRKLIPVVIRNLLSRQAPVLHGDGSALRDYLYVGDAIEATIRAALIKGNIDPLNIVRGKSVTLKDIVQLLIRLIGSYDEINYFPDKPNGTSYKFDNSRMEKIIGDWPKTHLTEGLAAEIAAFRRLLDE
jgi:nucleoside-diphosphate-sugar epimerase